MSETVVIEELVTVTANNRSKSKKPFRFSAQHDLLLFREVAAHNPFLTPAKWNLIARNLKEIGMSVDARRCRERTTLALNYFSKEEIENLRRSGTEEDYAEKEQLLQELLDLKKDATTVKEAQSINRKKNDLDSAAAQEIRHVMDSLGAHRTPSPNPSCSSMESGYSNKRRKESKRLIEYLIEKSEKEFQLRQKELELQERRIVLEEKRLMLEEKRHEAEKEEKSKLLEMLLKKL